MKYLFNLLDPADYLSTHKMYNAETGALEEFERIISLPEGPDLMFDYVDTTMYGRAPYHEHSTGWETFFIADGSCKLTVRGKSCMLEKGDMIHIQPWIAHQMEFPEPTDYRGIFHGINMSGTLRQLEYMREVNPALTSNLATMTNYLRRSDNIRREPPVSTTVPKSEVMEARSPDRPLAVYAFNGVTMKQYTGRWENGGLSELWRAEMDAGFFVDYYDENPNTDMFYITGGEVDFRVAGERFTAVHDCIVKIPPYAPRSFSAITDAVMFDIGGMTHWLDFFEDYTSLKTLAPARAADKAELDAVKKKHLCTVARFGVK